MNQFLKDNNFQVEIRDKLLYPFYCKIAESGRFIFADTGAFAYILQKELAIDTIIQTKNNKIVAIEEKIVRWPGYEYTAYTLEIKSCTVPGRERPGWMYYSKCDVLLYCFQQADGSLKAHAIPFRKLKNWFFEGNRFLEYYSTITEQINKTECKVVPIEDIFNAVNGCVIHHIPMNSSDRGME